MDLLDSLNILMRRWWLTLPILLVTILGAVAAVLLLPWSYESKATTVFLASSVQAKQTDGNPWMIFDRSLTITAEVVGREMMDDRTIAAIHARGLMSTYTVMVAANSIGPVLAITVTGKNNNDTAGTLNAVMQMIPDKLQQIQADGGVPPNARIRMEVISSSPQPTLKTTSKIRTLAIILFLGIGLTVFVPLFTESLSARRSGRDGKPVPKGKGRPEPAAGEGSGQNPSAPSGEPTVEYQWRAAMPSAEPASPRGGAEPHPADPPREREGLPLRRIDQHGGYLGAFPGGDEPPAAGGRGPDA